MKNYRKYQLLFSMSFLLIFSVVIFTIYILNGYYREYTNIRGIYILDNVIEIIVDTSTLKKIEKNNTLFLNSKKKKYQIISIEKNVYKDRKYYHQVLLKIRGINKDTKINVSIYNKKRKLIYLFIDGFKEE